MPKFGPKQPIFRLAISLAKGRRPATMTAFSLVMLGKFVFLVCVFFWCFFAVVAALRLNPAASLSLKKKKLKKLNHQDCMF